MLGHVVVLLFILGSVSILFSIVTAFYATVKNLNCFIFYDPPTPTKYNSCSGYSNYSTASHHHMVPFLQPLICGTHVPLMDFEAPTDENLWSLYSTPTFSQLLHVPLKSLLK